MTRNAIQHLRGVVLLQDPAGPTDGELLSRFVEQRDETAFAALVRRHGSMVWGVCRRVLTNLQDAEDAFQTTFLVLARKAAAVVPGAMVANWLYGVAHQAALHARRAAARRKQRERQVTSMPEPAVTDNDPWPDLQPILDQELSRLPDKYRAVVVLCDLEGKGRKEAARQLGCPEGTVAGRLARARALLAKRLTRRGVTLSSAALAVVLSRKAASGCAPGSVVSSTIKSASLFRVGQVANRATSANVTVLTEKVLKTMLINKLRTVAIRLFVLAALAFGGGLLVHQAMAGQEKPRLPSEAEPGTPGERSSSAVPNDAAALFAVGEPEPAKPPKPKAGPLGMKFVPLPKATFYMGWNGKKQGVKTEIKEDFEIAIHTVTQEQWEKVMGKNPSFFSRDGGGKEKVKDIKDEDLKLFPVEQVSWADAQEFIKKLNEKEARGGYVYRLPTEAEWEYACRGGATSLEECSFQFYLDKPTNDLSSKQANFNGTIPFGKGQQGPNLGRPTKVGSYVPNKLGLYDMHANVWQWCEDPYDPNDPLRSGRVMRGGCYFATGTGGTGCEAALRGRGMPRGSNGVGVRLVRVPVRRP
jgi:RNA polymerase sigma factor (sigma-70 family)